MKKKDKKGQKKIERRLESRRYNTLTININCKSSILDFLIAPPI